MRPSLLAVAVGMMALAVACGSGADTPPALDTTPAPSGPSRLLRLDWESRALRPVDPETLEALPGFEPFVMGHWATPLVSPDGRTLAAVIGESQVYVGEIYLYDLESWKETLHLEEPKGGLAPLAWSADSGLLYVGRERELWVVDVEAGEARLLADLGSEFDDVKVSRDGARLYVFAYLSSPQSALVQGAPDLLEVDAGTGEVTRRLQLPDVTIGGREEQRSDAEVQYAYQFPARVMSPDGGRYYIAHADSEVVTVINLDEMRIESSAEPKRPSSVWGSIGGFLGGLLVSEAEAKGGLYRSKQALVSPDGKILYVTGAYDGDPASEPSGREPLGLKAIDTRTMTVLFEEEGVSTIALSSDGGRLYGIGYSYSWTQVASNEYAQDNYAGIGMRALDARSGDLLAEIDPGRVYDRMLLASDGRHVLLFTDTIYEMPIEARRNLNYSPDQRVAIVDTETLTVAREVALGRFSAEFVAAP